MSDNDDEPPTNQARVYIRTSSANGFDGHEVEVTVEGAEDDDVDDVNAVAEERFADAVERSANEEPTTRPEYQ